MAKQIGDSIAVLRQYVTGVMDRVNHHALPMAAVATHVLSGVVLRADQGSLECREYAGRPANVLRFSVTGQPYALRFRHGPDRVELLKGRETSKHVVATFVATDSVDRVLGTFEQLP
ncbi:hypothetical protein KF840_19280 [bacterium]|nr:hypothetical protein [bacterium]